MKIAGITAIPLLGRIADAGWEEEVAATESVQTLIRIVTDEGLIGVGSAYTSHSLVESALTLLRPWCVGEIAIEPERVSEKLHQMSFW